MDFVWRNVYCDVIIMINSKLMGVKIVLVVIVDVRCCLVFDYIFFFLNVNVV